MGGIAVGGLLLRLPSLGNSLFGDEIGSYFIVTGHSLGRIVHILNGHGVDTNPPLYFWLARASEALLGDSERSLRLVSLLAGTTAIPMTYSLGRRTFGRGAGLIGAALIALSPYLIFFSTEARAYALVMVLLLGSTLALLRALEERGHRWWVAYAAISCAAMYTHYTSVIILAAQFIWAFWARPDARRSLLAANVAAGICYLPWLPALIRQIHLPGGTQVIQALEPFGLHAVGNDLTHAAIGHPYIALATVPGPFAIAMAAAGCTVGVVNVLFRWRPSLKRVQTSRLSSERALVVALAMAMPVGLILYSVVHKSLWDQRNLIGSWPGFAVAAGALLTSARGLVRFAAVGLVIAGFTIAALTLLSSSNQRPDYRAAVSFVEKTGRAEDPIAELPAPSPGPLSEVDAALAAGRSWASQRRPVVRIGQPSRQSVIRAAPYASLPVPSAKVLAQQAAALAGGGKLFVISFGAAPLSAVRTPGTLDAKKAFGPVFGSGVSGFLLGLEFAQLPRFIDALPASLRPLRTRTFPGFLPVSVYVFGKQSGSGQRAGDRAGQ